MTPRHKRGKRYLTRKRVGDSRHVSEQLERRFRDLLQGLDGIIWEADPHTFRFSFVSARARDILGYSIKRWLTEPDFWSGHIHPEDRERTVSFCRKATEEKKSYQLEYRMIAADGRIVWLRDVVTVVVKNGRSVKLQGLMIDITGCKRAEELLQVSEDRFKIVSRATNDAVWDWDLVTRAVWWNEGVQTLFGYLPEEVGTDITWWEDRIHPGDRERITSELRAVFANGGRFWSGEYRYRRGDGTYADIFDRGYVIYDERNGPVRMIGAMADITERKEAEEKIQRQVQELNLLIGAAQKLARSRNVDTLAQDILNTVVTSFGMRFAWLARAEQDGRVQRLYWAGDGADYLKKVEIRWDDSPLGQGPAGRAIRSGRPAVMDVTADENFAPWRSSALAHGYRSVAALPLISGDKPFGFLILYSAELDFFTPERVELLQTYSHIAAAALENARLFEETQYHLQRIRALHEINLAMTSALDLRAVLDGLLEKTEILLPNSGSVVRLFNPETGALQPVAWHNLGTDGWKARVLGSQRSLCRRAFESKAPLIIQDLQADAGQWDPEFARTQGLFSYLGLPLIAKEETLGTISFFTKEAHEFKPAEVDFLTTLASQAAMAIQNAQLYGQVRTGQEQLRTLSHRLAEAQESERRNISRELHDEIGQALTALKLKLDMSMHVSAEGARAHLGEARALANELIARVRHLSLDLRPAMLDDLGLLPTLRWHFQRYTALTNVAVDLEQRGLERLFPPEVATAAYRIVQEALTNVARHSGASAVGVRLHGNEETLSILIEDQGRGFDMHTILSSGGTSGLSGMRERAFSLGGKLTVESVPGNGTRVTALLPLKIGKEAGLRL